MNLLKLVVYLISGALYVSLWGCCCFMILGLIITSDRELIKLAVFFGLLGVLVAVLMFLELYWFDGVNIFEEIIKMRTY